MDAKETKGEKETNGISKDDAKDDAKEDAKDDAKAAISHLVSLKSISAQKWLPKAVEKSEHP